MAETGTRRGQIQGRGHGGIDMEEGQRQGHKGQRQEHREGREKKMGSKDRGMDTDKLDLGQSQGRPGT